MNTSLKGEEATEDKKKVNPQEIARIVDQSHVRCCRLANFSTLSPPMLNIYANKRRTKGEESKEDTPKNVNKTEGRRIIMNADINHHDLQKAIGTD